MVSRFSRPLLLDAVAIVVAWSFAITQPLLDVLGNNPEFFVAHAAAGSDIVYLAIAMAFVAPLVLAGITTLVSLAHQMTGRIVHRALLGLLLSEFAYQVFKHFPSIPGGVRLPLCVVLGVLAAWWYDRRPSFRPNLWWLSPAPIVFFVLFISASPASSLVFQSDVQAAKGLTISHPGPVVEVSFDEFPAISIMKSDGTIDAKAFPNFARLEQRSVWYRNATAISPTTTISMPSIMTGLNKPGIPVASQNPKSVFTMFGAFMPVQAYESVTQICPATICGSSNAGTSTASLQKQLVKDTGVVAGRVLLPGFLADRLPSIDQSWGNFGGGAVTTKTTGGIDAADIAAQAKTTDAHAGAAYRQTLAATDPAKAVQDFTQQMKGGKRQLYFLHIQMPHVPWRYLPSGQQYSPATLLPGLNFDDWSTDAWDTADGRARHLLQAQYADTLLGEILDAMDQNGLGNATLAVMADHGVAFTPGEPRREPLDDDVGDIAWVPLFIHAPGQAAKIDNRPAELIDVLPTLADIAGVKSNWKFDGVSLLGKPIPNRARVITRVVDHRQIRLGPGTKPRDTSLAEKWAALGHTASLADPHTAFKIGPDATLVGEDPPAAATPPTPLTMTLDQAATFANLNTKAASLPVLATGEIHGLTATDTAAPIDLLIVLNNVVAGTGRVDPSGTFVGLVDPSLMRSGVNTVDALISTGGGPFQTVDVLGAVKWTLGSSAPHRTLTGSNGIIAQETPGAIVGVASMDVSASSHLVIVSGWATLPHQAGVVDIVVVRNGVSIDTGSTGGERPDVAAVLKEPTITDSGFNLSIPVSQTGDPAKVTLEVFAVQGNQMTELAYFAGTQYRGAPAKTAPAATTTTAAT